LSEKSTIAKTMEIRVKVNSTYNNTIVTALHKDRILKTISTGSIGFKKAKRASTLAAQAAGESLGYWLLLLDKALSQKTPLTGSSISKSTSLKKEEDKKGNTPAKLDTKKKTGEGLDSLESAQIKELTNPKLKIPNAKLIASGGKLSTSSKDNKGKSHAVKKEKLSDSAPSSIIHASNSRGLTFKKSSSQKGLAFIKPLSVMVSGVGHGKFGAIKGLAKMGIKIQRISEITAIPHNGCKPPKMRRK